MTTTVTVSEFRENLSKYIELLKKKGNKVKITDGRSGKVLTTIGKKEEEEFDWDAHLKFMENFEPFWTKEDDKKLKELRKRSRERLKRMDW